MTEPTAYPYKVQLDARYRISAGDIDVRPAPTSVLHAAGEAVGENDEEVMVPSSERPMSDGGPFSVVTPTTCGRHSQPVKLSSSATEDEKRERLKKGVLETWPRDADPRKAQDAEFVAARIAKVGNWVEYGRFQTVEPQEPYWVELYIDNSAGADARSVTLGTVERTVAAGGVDTIALVVGPCPEARVVKLDGKKVGVAELSKKTRRQYKRQLDPKNGYGRFVAREGYLLDASNSLCYESEVELYSTDPMQTRTARTTIRAKPHKHPTVTEIGIVDDLFKRSPPSTGPKGQLQRRWLQRVNCK